MHRRARCIDEARIDVAHLVLIGSTPRRSSRRSRALIRGIFASQLCLTPARSVELPRCPCVWPDQGLKRAFRLRLL